MPDWYACNALMGISKHMYGTNDIRKLLKQLTDDPDRPGLKDTPARVLRYWSEVTAGYQMTPGDVLKCFEDGAEGVDEMVFQGAIPFFSVCEHHLVTFFGLVHIAYIPDGKIVGLSKFARLVEVFARRLQVQERLTTQIADALNQHLKPKGVGVAIRARHLCLESRGVQKIGTITYTSALRGLIKEAADARSEFLHYVQLADARSSNL